MPRRISDYPDAFAGWNLISSFGSIISVVATWLFLNIVYVQLVYGESVSRYPWATPQFYTDLLQHLLNRAYTSIEWCLNSPPKPHAFDSLPLQSSRCVHGLLTISCMICKVQAEHHAKIAGCTHTFKELNKDSHILGVACDFSSKANGAQDFHVVAAAMEDIVRFCAECGAVICSHCYGG